MPLQIDLRNAAGEVVDSVTRSSPLAIDTVSGTVRAPDEPGGMRTMTGTVTVLPPATDTGGTLTSAPAGTPSKAW